MLAYPKTLIPFGIFQIKLETLEEVLRNTKSRENCRCKNEMGWQTSLETPLSIE